MVDKELAIKPATLGGDWSFIPRETVGNDTEHAHHKYPAQKGRELGYLHSHIQDLLTDSYMGLLISRHFTFVSHSDS